MVSSVPARVGLWTLLGAALASPEKLRAALGAVPAATLTRWRELAAEGGPCAECADPLCELARAVLAYR